MSTRRLALGAGIVALYLLYGSEKDREFFLHGRSPRAYDDALLESVRRVGTRSVR